LVDAPVGRDAASVHHPAFAGRTVTVTALIEPAAEAWPVTRTRSPLWMDEALAAALPDRYAVADDVVTSWVAPFDALSVKPVALIPPTIPVTDGGRMCTKAAVGVVDDFTSRTFTWSPTTTSDSGTSVAPCLYVVAGPSPTVEVVDLVRMTKLVGLIALTTPDGPVA
jgi:hypothetical protein